MKILKIERVDIDYFNVLSVTYKTFWGITRKRHLFMDYYDWRFTDNYRKTSINSTLLDNFQMSRLKQYIPNQDGIK